MMFLLTLCLLFAAGLDASEKNIKHILSLICLLTIYIDYINQCKLSINILMTNRVANNVDLSLNRVKIV